MLPHRRNTFWYSKRITKVLGWEKTQLNRRGTSGAFSYLSVNKQVNDSDQKWESGDASDSLKCS